MTREIIAVAKAMGIVVHDHIIVGRAGPAMPASRALG
jgi:DNA repair protein RadC